MKNPSDAVLLQSTQALAKRLTDKHLRLVCAESCTGGWLAKCCTDLPGCSVWFEGGIVSYSNRLKMHQLQVPAPYLEQHGAVSAHTVEAMAFGALQTLGGDLSIAISGIAGPGGGSPEKPLGTVWFAIASHFKPSETHRQCFTGDREAVRRQAVAFALERLKSYLG